MQESKTNQQKPQTTQIMNETTTISETQNPTNSNSHNNELAIVTPLEPEGVRVECGIRFIGDAETIAEIENLTGAEQLKLLISALSHISDGLQEQLSWSE